MLIILNLTEHKGLIETQEPNLSGNLDGFVSGGFQMFPVFLN